MIEIFRIVVPDALRQNLFLPRIGRNLEALQLPQDFKQTALPAQLRTLSNMLPTRQPAHELRWSHRLNLFAQCAKREAMDARKEAPIAPFGDSVMTGKLA